jgi:hypothetical protein
MSIYTSFVCNESLLILYIQCLCLDVYLSVYFHCISYTPICVSSAKYAFEYSELLLFLIVWRINCLACLPYVFLRARNTF